MTPPSVRQLERRVRVAFWALLLGIMTVTLAGYFLADLELAFFSHDAEAELLAVRSIADSGFARAWIPWTAAYGSFHEELLPFGENFLSVHEHRLHASRPLPFLYLSAAVYRWLGVAGLYVVSALAALAAIALGQRIARTGSSAAAAGWVLPVLGFTTPILFYGLCYWNMIVGAALATCAVWLLLQETGRYAAPLGGALLAVGISVRPELVVLAIPLIYGTARRAGFGPTLALLVGMGAVGAGVGALNQAVFGDPLGPHLAGNEVPFASWIVTRPRVLYDLFLASLAEPWVEALASAAGAVAILPASIGILGSGTRAILLWVFALGAGRVALATLLSPDPYASSLENHSLLACAPFLFLLFFFPSGEDRRVRALRWLAVVCVLAAALLCPPQAAHAAHWGPRILVGLLPIMGVAACSAATAYLATFRGRWVGLAIATLLLAGFVNQVHSLRLLYFKKAETAVLQAELGRVELPIVSGDWIVPADLASWYPRRALWFPRSATDLERIFVNLELGGQKRMLVLARDGSPLDLALRGLVARGRLRAEPRQPIRSRLFPYRNMNATVYEALR